MRPLVVLDKGKRSRVRASANADQEGFLNALSERVIQAVHGRPDDPIPDILVTICDRRQQMAKARVKEIKYYEIVNVLGPSQWRCHVYTDDGSHYEGEGYTKDEAKDNALEVMRAND
jgi:hypothetical protein